MAKKVKDGSVVVTVAESDDATIATLKQLKQQIDAIMATHGAAIKLAANTPGTEFPPLGEPVVEAAEVVCSVQKGVAAEATEQALADGGYVPPTSDLAIDTQGAPVIVKPVKAKKAKPTVVSLEPKVAEAAKLSGALSFEDVVPAPLMAAHGTPTMPPTAQEVLGSAFPAAVVMGPSSPFSMSAQAVAESAPLMMGSSPVTLFGVQPMPLPTDALFLSKQAASVKEALGLVGDTIDTPVPPEPKPGPTSESMAKDIAEFQAKVLAGMQVPVEFLGGTIPKPTVVAPSTVTVTKQMGKDGKDEVVEEKTLAVHKFITQPATVGVEYGLTLNLGNYESARVTVTVTVPCYAEEKDAAFEAACKWADERVAQQRDAIRALSQKPSF